MLKTLEIQNVALISRLSIDFSEGLNVLSGETGSGKSIIVDSLAFVLGDRADKTLIKYGEQYASVTALFTDVGGAAEKLREYGYDDGDELLISRKMTAAGKNEIRIQGKTSTLAILKEVCAELADIFGQGQHLALLKEKNQLAVLDSFCNFGGDDAALKEYHSRLGKVSAQLRALGGSDYERERTLDILRFQIEEIKNAELSQQEEEQLLAAHKRMVNAEKIAVALGEALEGVDNAVTGLSGAVSRLGDVAAVEERANDLSARLESGMIEAEDVRSTLEDMLSSLEFSEEEADRINNRIEEIRRLKRKYGGSVEAALQFLADAEKQYDDLQNAAQKRAELLDEQQDILEKMYGCACRITAERQRAAAQLSLRIKGELDQLGMKGTDFTVQFNTADREKYFLSPSPSGADEVIFLMSANVGEPLKPLSKVISGGEMSRFMLAVKNITAQAEKIPTMVFDEIDSGVSGNMAQMVAQKLASAARGKQGYQCIVITHLPQIAAMSDRIVRVEKRLCDGRTETFAQALEGNGRIEEVARLMGGVGQHAIVNAEELVQHSEKYKSTLE